MFHIFLLGYVYVILMFSFAQGSVVRGLIYFFFFAGFPVLFLLWVRGQKMRNRKIVQLVKESENDQENLLSDNDEESKDV